MRIVLDIETLPCPEERRSLLREPQPPPELQDPQALEKWRRQVLPRLYEEAWLRSSLNGTLGRIFCIGVLRVDEGLRATAFYGNDEGALLSRFWQSLAEVPRPYLITHNGVAFDLPFLWRRSVVHQVRPSLPLEGGRYPRELCFDTLEAWSAGEGRHKIDLGTLSQVLGLGAKTRSAEEVLGLWRQGRYQELAAYCIQDLYLTYGVWCRLHFLPVAPRHEVQEEYISCDPSPVAGDGACPGP
jgi:DNA polymerase elongation subunit (family B)